ncbi:MAG: hypothetical protein JXA11_02830 [Phycisphaerae bacterium]|nr:hypothetical protein [Phycisphaerae bacterium]
MKRMMIALTVLVLVTPVLAQTRTGNRQAMGNPQVPVKAWWSGTTAGWIGAVGGSVVGLSGALIGVMCSLGKARRFVLGFHLVMIVLGIASLITGIVALLVKQPYGVWYPLVLLGGILTIVLGSLFFTVRQRFLQIELRKMQGMDA